jgi:hypothetical protein
MDKEKKSNHHGAKRSGDALSECLPLTDNGIKITQADFSNGMKIC